MCLRCQISRAYSRTMYQRFVFDSLIHIPPKLTDRRQACLIIFFCSFSCVIYGFIYLWSLDLVAKILNVDMCVILIVKMKHNVPQIRCVHWQIDLQLSCSKHCFNFVLMDTIWSSAHLHLAYIYNLDRSKGRERFTVLNFVSFFMCFIHFDSWSLDKLMVLHQIFGSVTQCSWSWCAK